LTRRWFWRRANCAAFFYPRRQRRSEIGTRGFSVRIVFGLVLALILSVPAAADDYGAKLCRKHLSSVPGMNCTCVGPLVEEEYDEDEAETVLGGIAVMTTVSEKDDMAAIERKFKAYQDEHGGAAKVDALMQRLDKIQLEKKCPIKP
jgi:hypothetical protein